jgi:N-acetyl-anhydromuramyl-L-alanine amidase AmpD
MATIAYDQHVTDYIAALSATGHVTHTRYKKTSVTFHHNGGNLTHAGVLSVWKTRPASAHFDVDAQGRVAQYVDVAEYAWAVGNRGGNETTISIEMADKTFAPKWEVSEVTWKEAARLAGWLFAKVIKDTPTKNNVHYHHDWSSTECPGPYMDSIRAELLAEVQKWYAHFTENPSSPHPTTPPKKTYAEVAREVINGQYGNNPQRAKKLESEGYDPDAVQTEVNRLLKKGTGTTKPAPAKKSVNELAKEVLAGKWGNGADRRRLLTAKGYNYDAVQKEVNRLVG